MTGTIIVHSTAPQLRITNYINLAKSNKNINFGDMTSKAITGEFAMKYEIDGENMFLLITKSTIQMVGIGYLSAIYEI